MDWKECADNNLVKQKGVDKGLIDSLLKTSEMKLESNNRLELDEITAATKIGIAYDSLRELLEVLAIKKGFKVYNHECFCAFLSEICGNKTLADEFDIYRKVRNQINYYGKSVNTEEADNLIKGMNSLRNKIKQIIKLS